MNNNTTTNHAKWSTPEPQENPIVTENNKVLRCIEFSVTANSGAWGINRLRFKGLEYHGDPIQFQKDIMQKVFMMGYTAILHYNDDLNLLMCCYNNNKELFETILRHIRLNHIYSTANNALQKIKATENKDEQDKIAAEAAKAGVDVHVNQYTGEWGANIGCFIDGDAVARGARVHGSWLYTCKEILQLVGFDPEDRAKTRRICENLGMYRPEF